MPTLKPATEKLPLAVRKNIRDEWEAKRPEFEQKITTLLEQPWTVTINPNLIYANVNDESYSPRIGSVIGWYMDAFMSNLSSYIQKFGDDGKTELNTTCTQHQLNFGPQDTTSFTYGGLDIQAGVLQLVYSVNSFATNVDDVSRDIAGTLKKAAAASGTASAFNVVARNSVKENYDPEVDAVQAKIAALVGVPSLKLNPMFEQNAAALAKHGNTGRSDWDKILGQSTLSYFQGVAYQLGRNGFEGDDMLQEGFQEGVEKNEIAVRVVDKLKSGTYNEIIIEDGVLYVQTTVDNWWANVDDCAQKILEIL